jgi:hypothetical protein
MEELVVWWIVVGISVLFLLWRYVRRAHPSAIVMPFCMWQEQRAVPRSIRMLSRVFYFGSLLFLSLAFVQCVAGNGPFAHLLPQSTFAIPPPPPSQSRMLFFLVDRSGSMGEPMPTTPQYSKINVVKEGLTTCVSLIDSHGGINDLLGLIALARIASVDVPLSRDRAFLTGVIGKLVPETNNRLNGTAIGYGIFKTVSLIVACRAFAEEENVSKQPQSNTVLFVTDGIEEPNPADRSHPFRSMRALQALRYAADNHVRVHYINIDERSYHRLLPEERDQLIQAVEKTGGTYFEITINQSLGQVMSRIVEAEVPQQVAAPPHSRSELGFWLIVLALLFASSSRLLESGIVRLVR